jgi:glycosyltransferase involved in cell wall biosynthesis
LGEQVTIINRQVDVNDVLAQVHAAIVLAGDTRLVKAYPHSLLEALAAGKPILVSRGISMADYVERTGCGQIVESVSVQQVLVALARLESSYASCQAVAMQVRDDFSHLRMVEAYKQLYAAIKAYEAD